MTPAGGLREATPEELATWNARTVDAPGGHIFQSRTWGEYRRRNGWRPTYLVFEDGFSVLSAARPWPWLGGSGAYLARGPISGGEPAEVTADRLRAVADWLGSHGTDVVSSDAEIPAATGYADLLRARGFHGIEEVQPSRHRMWLPLDPAAGPDSVLAGFTKSLRQTIRTAEHRGVRVIRHDARWPEASASDSDGRFDRPDLEASSADAMAPVFERFHDLLARTAVRRHFPLLPRAGFIDASSHAVADGLAFHLEAHAPDGELISAALFYRHGRRVTYALSADRVEQRGPYPGVVQLVLWRAIQIALDERREEFDLAGVDIKGARQRPGPGDEMHGLYLMKERFGARWLDLAGNHEWVARPWRYAAGRLAARVARLR